MASDKYETTGIVHKICDPETRGSGDKKFTSQTLVLATEPGKYEQFPAWEFGEKRMGELKDLRVGDTVKVEWNLRGRRWDGPKGEKWFTTLSGWKVTIDETKPRGEEPDENGEYGAGAGDGEIPF